MTPFSPESAREFYPDPRSVAFARRVSWLCGGLVVAVALIVLVGWVTNQLVLTGLGGEITMKTNSAISLLLCGIALLIRTRVPRVAAVLGAAAATLGVLTLCQHLFGIDLGIDQALFTEAPGAIATASPNRMGPSASTSVVLAGAALILLARDTPRSIQIAQRLAVIGLVLAMVALSGFAYGATQLYAIAWFTGIASHTALALFALHIGLFTARTDAGPITRLVSSGPEGTMLRRQALPMTIVPFLVGYLMLLGIDASLLDRGLSLALIVMSLVLLLWVTIWSTAWSLEQSDGQRRRLERGVDQLLIRERQARDDAERASRVKDQFIATLSHELRTPLNVMLGWTQILEAGSRPEQQARAASVVARNGRLLARLIEDLLDISRATVGQFEVTRAPVSLNTITQAAVDAVTPAATAKPVALIIELDPGVGTIDADADRLQQVIGNLLSNAVKFTPADGQIRVCTRAQGATVLLEVSDNGIGFDESFMRYIFEPFRQADPSTRRQYGGLGLGLSIAKHLVELHGGSIAAASEGPGRGARFTVTLPAKPAELAPATPVLSLDLEQTTTG